MAYVSRRLKLDPYIARFPTFLNVDYEIDKLVYPQNAKFSLNNDGEIISSPWRVYAIDGDGKFETLWATNRRESTSFNYYYGDHLNIVFVSIDGNYYMRSTGFSKDKGENFTLFSTVSGKPVHGWNWNGNVWYNSSISFGDYSRVYVSLNEGGSWHLRYDRPDDSASQPPGSPIEDYNYRIEGAFAGSVSGWNVASSSITCHAGTIWNNTALGTSSDMGLDWLFNTYSIMEDQLGLNYMDWLVTLIGKPLMNEDGSTTFQLLAHLWSTFGFNLPRFTALYRKSGSSWSIPISEIFFTGTVTLESVSLGNINTTYYSPKDGVAIVTYKYGSLYSTERVAYSIDDGITWEELTMPELQKIYGDYQFAYWNDTLYVSWSHGPLYKTTDWGEEWELVWEDYDVDDDGSAEYWEKSGYFSARIGGNTILLRSRIEEGNHGSYGFRGSYVIISKDLGETWDYVPELTTRPGWGRDLVSADGNKIVSWCYTDYKDYWNREDDEAYGWKVRISSDGGESWKYIDTPVNGYPHSVGSFVGDSTLRNILACNNSHIGGFRNQLWFSPNGGRGWLSLTEKLPSFTNLAHAQISGDGSTIYVILEGTTDDGVVYKTQNYGSDWEIIVKTSDTLYIPWYTPQLFVSHDGSGVMYQGNNYLIRIVNGVKERFSNSNTGSTLADQELENIISFTTTGVWCRRIGETSLLIQRDENSWMNSNYKIGPNSNYEYTQGSSRDAISATPNLDKIIIASEDAPFAWLVEGWCGAGLIKSISSASYRNPKNINRVSTVLTTANLKKIASQPDNPIYLDDI